MRRLVLASAVLIACGSLHGTASAQTRGAAARPLPPSTERFRIVFDGGALVNPQAIAQDFTVVKNAENAPVTTNLKPATSGYLEFGGRVRVDRRYWIGAVAFLGSGSADGTVDAQVPHPFYFNQFRPISGDVKRLGNSVRGAHIEFVYPVAMSTRREVTVFGGPSIVSARQTLVTDVTFTDAYPFDTATFQSATTAAASKAGVGFNVGADVMWRLNRSVFAGGLVRYTQANLTLSPASGNEVTVHAGGLQIGAGVRVLLQKRQPGPRRPTPARPSPPRRR